jgi:hypothetical protein
VADGKFFIFLSYRNPEFCIVFHHRGEFVNDNNSRFYRGGVQTIVNGQKMDEWNHKSHVMNIVKGWGYAENRFTLWSRFN